METTTIEWTLVNKGGTDWVQYNDGREEPATPEIAQQWKKQAVKTQRAVSGNRAKDSAPIPKARTLLPTPETASLSSIFHNLADGVRRGFHNFIHLSPEELKEYIATHRSSYDQVQKMGNPIDRLTASELLKKQMQELLQRANANEKFTENVKQPAKDLLTEVQSFYQSAIEDCYQGWKESIETSLRTAEEQNSVFSKEELRALTEWHGNLKALCEKYRDHLPEDTNQLASQLGQQIAIAKQKARHAAEPVNWKQLGQAQDTLLSLQNEYNSLLDIKNLTPQDLCTMLHDIKKRADHFDLSSFTQKTDTNAKKFVTHWQVFLTTLNAKISSLPQPPESWFSNDS